MIEYRVAHTRADVEALVRLLDGEYRPTARDRRKGTLWALVLAVVAAVMYWAIPPGDTPWITVMFVALPVMVGIARFAGARDTYVVEPHAVTRRAWLRVGSWSVSVAEIDAIDLEYDDGSATLFLDTKADQRRRFPLGEAARARMAKLYPHVFGKIDYAAIPEDDRERLAEMQTTMLRRYAVVAAISLAVLVIRRTIEPGSLPRIVELLLVPAAGNLAAGGLITGLLGVAYCWWQRRQLVRR